MSVNLPSLAGRVGIVTGASRGIGRALALALAKAGANVVVAAKSTESTPELPGSVYTVADEVEALGAKALPFPLDVRDDVRVAEMATQAHKEFGRIDYLINNAGALWWQPIEKTPMERYDLINAINSRASFSAAQAVLPFMREQGYGHVIMQSPPLEAMMNDMAGKVGYSVSKLGMTIAAMGIAQEYKQFGVAGNTIWPCTLVESYATINHKLGDTKMWRKAEVLTDSIVHMLGEDPADFSGNQLLDEVYLRSKGETDFSKYQCEPGFEPPPLADIGKMLSAARARDKKAA